MNALELGGAPRVIDFIDSIKSIPRAVTVINVTQPQPTFVSSIAPKSVLDAPGLTMDRSRKRLFVASVRQASVTCIDVTEPRNPKVIK